MRGFNNDKLWIAFEASGCVGDYLNYRVSKITAQEMKLINTDYINNNKKDSNNGYKDNWSRYQAT